MKATAWELEDSTSVIMHTDDSVLIVQGGGEVVVTKEQLQQILSLFGEQSATTQNRVKKSLKDLKVGDKLLCIDNSLYRGLFTNNNVYKVLNIYGDYLDTEADGLQTHWDFTEDNSFQKMFDVLI